MVQKLLLLLLLVVSTVCFSQEKDSSEEGGIHVGNGGKTIFCVRPDGSEGMDLLDFHENVILNYFESFTGTESVYNLVRYAIDNLETIDPERHRRLSNYNNSFTKDARFISGIRLASLSDIGLVILPKGCELKQAVVQSPPEDVIEGITNRYTFDRSIWDRLDIKEKAGLVLHELVYRDFIESSNHTTSFYVRMLVRYLASNSPKLQNLPSYIGILKKLRVKSFTYKGIAIDLTSPIEFYEDMNAIRSAKLIVPQSFKVLGEKIKTYSRVTHHFFRNGKVRFLSVMPEYGSVHETTIWSFNSPTPLSIDVALQEIVFEEDGRVKLFKISKDIFLNRKLKIGSMKHYDIAANSLIKFDKDRGFPIEFTINREGKLDIGKTAFIRWDGQYYSKYSSYNVGEVITPYQF